MKAPFEFLIRRTRQAMLYFRVWSSVVSVRSKLASSGYAAFEQSPIKVSDEKADISPAYIALVVQRVSKLVPGALCLAQAVTAQRLLARFGYETTMRIGVKSKEVGDLKAHAWLIHEGRVILGGTMAQLEAYQVITAKKSATTT